MPSAYADRIAALAAEARAIRERADGSTLRDHLSDGSIRIAGETVSDPDAAALVAARDGLGSVVAIYVEARTADEWVWFSEREMHRLHAATRDWLAVYASCRGSDAAPDVTVREAAEVLLDTHDVTDVADLLTGLHRA